MSIIMSQVMNRSCTVEMSCAALAVAVPCVIVALHAVLGQLRSNRPKDRFYEDRDGFATPEAMAKFSTKQVKFLILLLSTSGAGSFAGSLVLSPPYRVRHSQVMGNILYLAAWVSYVPRTTSEFISHIVLLRVSSLFMPSVSLLSIPRSSPTNSAFASRFPPSCLVFPLSLD